MAEAQLSFINRIRKKLNFNRLDRLVQHYVAIKDHLTPKNAKDKDEVAFFSQEFERYARQTQRLANIRFVFWALLYAALFINVLKIIPFLAFLVAFIEIGSAVFGTTLLFIIVFVLSIRIRLNLELMQDCMSHLIVIYHQNAKRDTQSMLREVAKAI